MKVRVLGICGSPRKPSNSGYLLDQALEEAQKVSEKVEIKKYSFVGKKFAPCLSCFKCEELKGECVQKDSLQELKDMWLEADVVLYSIPVYHMTIPGQLKCFIDRLGNTIVMSTGTMLKQCKVIGAIVQAASICAGQEHAMTDIINHALVMGSIPAAGDLWQSYIGAGGWTHHHYTGDALKKLHKKGEFGAEVTVKASRDVGRRTVLLALIVKQGAIIEREMLEKEGATYKPLLDRL